MTPAHSSGATFSMSRRLRDLQHEVLVDDDGLGVAALGDGAVVVDTCVGLDVAVEAVHLFALEALLALTAGPGLAADADAVADLVLGDRGADLADVADDLVADDLGVGDLAPVAADGVDVGVADAGVGDVDEDVVRSQVTALDGGRDERLGGRGSRVGVDGEHGSPCVGSETVPSGWHRQPSWSANRLGWEALTGLPSTAAQRLRRLAAGRSEGVQEYLPMPEQPVVDLTA